MKQAIGMLMIILPVAGLIAATSICTGIWWFGFVLMGGVVFIAAWFALAAYLLEKK